MTDPSPSTPESDLRARVARALDGAHVAAPRALRARMDTLVPGPWPGFPPVPAPVIAEWDAIGAKFESKQLRKEEKRMRKEARALSKEIGYVLAAADELREIDGRP